MGVGSLQPSCLQGFKGKQMWRDFYSFLAPSAQDNSRKIRRLGSALKKEEKKWKFRKLFLMAAPSRQNRGQVSVMFDAFNLFVLSKEDLTHRRC